MLSPRINLALVDEHALLRKTLTSYLSEQNNINVIVQASDMRDLRPKLNYISVDVLLMDVMMRGLNGRDALKLLKKEYPSIKVVVLSMSMDMELISDLLASGIYGYIPKSDDPEELLRAIQAASEGRIYRNKLFTEALYWSKQCDIITGTDDSGSHLNDREKKILQLIWEEKSNKQIADALFLGVRSVEKIRQDMKEKIGAKTTVGLLKYAIIKRIITTYSSRSEGEYQSNSPALFSASFPSFHKTRN